MFSLCRGTAGKRRAFSKQAPASRRSTTSALEKLSVKLRLYCGFRKIELRPFFLLTLLMVLLSESFGLLRGFSSRRSVGEGVDCDKRLHKGVLR